ncbi:MAG: hypothetical protein IPO70_06005 [Bacteroidetes bacterium]|nr:hypothetical protein [Bacteroidota bacterium]
MQEKICPYPGLRPFNEEESIFFRGREEHIEKIISQLEEKKFVMLTGASGDGKSSLVYAGVLPNARAGFFKAKFNNWLIADFRPERTPLKNLSAALASKLNLDEKTVEQELNFGFSSLINLYKKSDFYLDSNSDNYKNAEESEKKKLKRKAANLFVLVDQFEEFFTNPENYKNGQASNESQLVVNLLLETARIALAEDLPIYIVCTMRSDYIGQCAAFRGLPEYIGYSQFFVPRLKRKEIHQVINEPALLSGNSISNRLVETLINEIGDGFDQLPVLQHALNRIWNKTNKGQYEMDLLHLAMVGGLAPSQLPENDRAIFDGWFTSVAENKKLFFKKPSLDAVLNAHAQELYETAHEYYNEQHSEKIEKGEAQLIIKTAFQCLTKIDESRAVRNRMSLQEITNIVNDSSISVEKVDGVLRIFRLQGNTFLKPFANSDTENECLNPETVLDITHESLIRNWELLEQWAKEEHENWLTFQDFYKQLQRWTSNDIARGFLLPIGPLTFFENWYTKCKPNKYWLARYDESNVAAADKLKMAEAILESASEFINRSARNLFFSRTVLKYGAGKLIAVVGMLLLLFACTYYYLDFKKKQNVAVLERINTRAIDLLGSPDVSLSYKADFLINTERLNENKGNNSYTTFENLLNSINNDSMAFDIGYAMLNQCKTINSDDSLAYDKQGFLSMKVFTYLFHRFENDANSQVLDLSKKKNSSIKLERINKFLGLCALMKNSYTQRDSAAVETICSKAIWLTKNLLINSMKVLKNKDVEIDIPSFNYSVNILLSIDDSPDYKEFLFYFDEDLKNNSRFNTKYSHPASTIISCINYGNGYNEVLGMILATIVDKDSSVLSRINDLVNKNNRKIKDYKPLPIYYSLIKHSKLPLHKFDSVLNKIVQVASLMLDERKVDVLGRIAFNSSNKISSLSKENFNSNLFLFFIDKERKEEFWNNYLGFLINKPYKISSLNDALNLSYSEYNDSIQLEVANYFKARGLFYDFYLNNKKEQLFCFKKMLSVFSTVSSKYYLENTELMDTYIQVGEVANYTYLFLPKIDSKLRVPYKCRGYTIGFNEYLELVKSKAFIILFYNLSESNIDMLFEQSSLVYFNSKELNPDAKYSKEWKPFFNKILKYEKHKEFRPIRTVVNQNIYVDTIRNNYSIVLCPLIEIIYALDGNNIDQAKKIYHENAANFSEKTVEGQLIITVLKEVIQSYAVNGCIKESINLLQFVTDKTEKQDLLLEICNTLQTEGPIENTFVYLDKLLEGSTRETAAGMGLFRVLGKIGGKEINAIAQTKLRKTPELLKPKALQNLIKGVAERGNYYEALQYMPEYISESKELSLYNEILKAEILKRENKTAKNAYKGNWNDAAFFELDLGTKNGSDLQFNSLD